MPAKKGAGKPRDYLLRPGSGLFELFFENAPVMMVVVDQKERHVKVNRRWRQVLGYAKEEVIGKPISELLTDAEYGRLSRGDISELWRRGYLENRHVDAIAKDGKIIPLVADTEVLADSEGNRFFLAIARPAAETRPGPSRELMAVVEELQAIALSLRVIARAQEERSAIGDEQLRELVASSNDIGRSIGELAEAVLAALEEE